MKKITITEEQAERFKKQIADTERMKKPEDCHRSICLNCNHALEEELDIFEKKSWHSRDIYKCPHCESLIVKCLGDCGRYFSADESFNRLCIHCIGYGAKTVAYKFFLGVAECGKKFLDQTEVKKSK